FDCDRNTSWKATQTDSTILNFTLITSKLTLQTQIPIQIIMSPPFFNPSFHPDQPETPELHIDPRLLQIDNSQMHTPVEPPRWPNNGTLRLDTEPLAATEPPAAQLEDSLEFDEVQPLNTHH